MDATLSVLPALGEVGTQSQKPACYPETNRRRSLLLGTRLELMKDPKDSKETKTACGPE